MGLQLNYESQSMCTGSKWTNAKQKYNISQFLFQSSKENDGEAQKTQNIQIK